MNDESHHIKIKQKKETKKNRLNTDNLLERCRNFQLEKKTLDVFSVLHLKSGKSSFIKMPRSVSHKHVTCHPPNDSELEQKVGINFWQN